MKCNKNWQELGSKQLWPIWN